MTIYIYDTPDNRFLVDFIKREILVVLPEQEGDYYGWFVLYKHFYAGSIELSGFEAEAFTDLLEFILSDVANDSGRRDPDCIRFLQIGSLFLQEISKQFLIKTYYKQCRETLN